MEPWTSLVRFLFLKAVFYSYKQGEQWRQEDSSDSLYFYSEKYKKYKNIHFLGNTKMVVSVFSETVLKNSFQKQEPNKPICTEEWEF